MLIVDFETRSPVDLTVEGTYLYAIDPSTEVICCSFALSEGGDVWTWHNPRLYSAVRRQKMPLDIYAALHDPSVMVAAHNAGFDRLIWELVARRDFPDMFTSVPLHHWTCTSALARVNALPASLDNATRALKSDHRKDHRGAALIRKLSIPQEDGTFCEDPDLLMDMAHYCADDVRATRELVNRCRGLTEQEQADWVLNERINERGVCIDSELATYAVQYASAETQEIGARLGELTTGLVTKHTQSARVSGLVRATLEASETPDAVNVMVRYKGNKKRYSLDKSVRAELLDRAAEFNLPDWLIEVIELYDDGNMSSVSKFRTMLAMRGSDDRVRGAFVYAGATTIRFTSRGLQLHNFKRDCFKQHEADALVDRMVDRKPLDNVMTTLSRALRPAIVPEREDAVFVTSDWSSIEGMGLPWLANSPGAERYLDLYRRKEDVYLHTAASIAMPGERQIGKVTALSMGYGGAVGAFNAMARNYGVYLPEATVVQNVKRWRRENAWAPTFWYALKDAAVNAILNPGKTFEAGRVVYYFEPALLDGTLFCVLPGDTFIQYPKARLETDRETGRYDITALKANWTPKADATEWPRYTLWHGLLAENATQGFCGGILRYTLRKMDVDPRLRNLAARIVSHCHDEIVLECPESNAEIVANGAEHWMNTPPPFAKGLPLRAEPVVSYRYGHKPE